MVFAVVSGFLVVLVAAIVAVLLFWSWPGKPKPLLDESGHPLSDAMSEKVRVDINGFEQGMFLRARDKTRPVLLYLHGGMPEYFLTRRYPTGLETEFVVCWWEQRGAGLSYRPRMPPESVTVQQLVADTLALTNDLRRRLCRAERREVLTRKLEAAPVTLEGGVPPVYLRVRDEAMHALGVGTMREMRSVVTGLFLPSLQNRDYTLAEKINLWRGKAATGVSTMWKEMLATDLAERVPEVGVPEAERLEAGADEGPGLDRRQPSLASGVLLLPLRLAVIAVVQILTSLQRVKLLRTGLDAETLGYHSPTPALRCVVLPEYAIRRLP